MSKKLLHDTKYHKAIEEKMKRDKERTENYLNIAGVMIVVINRQGKITLMNKKGNEILGYKNGDLIGKNWFTTCLPKENRKVLRSFFQKCLIGKLKFTEHYENEVITKKGEKKLISWYNTVLKDKNGVIVGTLSSGEDVTKQKKLEEELIHSKEFYLSLIESSNDGIIILQDNNIKFFNKQILEITGFLEKEIYGKSFLNFVSDKYKKLVSDRYKLRVEGKKVDPRYGIELLKKNGSSFPVEINTSTVKYNGRMAVLAIIRDMTKAKEIDKMKSEFVSVASHQLRTPLTGIKWFSELLLGGKAGVLSDKQEDFIEQILKSSGRMMNLVDDLLDVSHIEASEKYQVILKKVNGCSIFNSVIEEQKIIANNKKIKIDHLCGIKEDFFIKADKNKLPQAIANLLSNSIKYTHSGGKIFVGCKRVDGGVIYFVKDNGIGIPANQQNKVFEKFFRADNVASVESGTGLGLYITKYIVDKHHGKIWFESKEGKGTEFNIFLQTI